MGEKEPRLKPHISRLIVRSDKVGNLGYEVEFEFPYGSTTAEFEAARQRGLQAINTWLNEKQQSAPPTTAKPLDPAELDKLPWKLYKQGHRAGWVFTDKAEQLAQLIRHSETGMVQIGEFEYDFSGPKGENPTLFIRRTPIEPKKEASA